MKHLTLIIAWLFFGFGHGQSSSKEEDIYLNQDLVNVVDSISQLMSEYHYNPKELSSTEYLSIKKRMYALANSSRTKQEFIDSFNRLWDDGPFSHVLLGIAHQSADKMADFIDSLRVGDEAISLEWKNKTAILTVNTMTGLDTYERLFDVYQEIADKKAKTLIIDVRNNPGGTFAIVPLVGHLITDTVDAGMFVSNKWWANNMNAPNFSDAKKLEPWRGWSIKSFWNDVQKEPITRVQFHPMQPYFYGKVFILTSHKSASATEFAVETLAREKNVTIIGETTAGEMLSQKMFDLPLGLQLSLPIAEYYSSRIGKIEGKGVVPDIVIDANLAMDLAIALANGKKLERAMVEVKQGVEKKDLSPLGQEKIYLFGTMNDWGKIWEMTPKFEYKGEGIYIASTTLKKGKYEFKIAPMDWNYDYGASPNQGVISVGSSLNLARMDGSSNVTIEIKEEAILTFSLNVKDKMMGKLSVSKE